MSGGGFYLSKRDRIILGGSSILLVLAAISSLWYAVTLFTAAQTGMGVLFIFLGIIALVIAAIFGLIILFAS